MLQAVESQKKNRGSSHEEVPVADTSRFYAVSIIDLTDWPGFPILIDGYNADNDPSRYFIGGTVLQRPSLIMIGGNAYGAFGGHCDL